MLAEKFAQGFVGIKAALQGEDGVCDKSEGCIGNLAVEVGVLAGAQPEVLFAFFE